MVKNHKVEQEKWHLNDVCIWFCRQRNIAKSRTSITFPRTSDCRNTPSLVIIGSSEFSSTYCDIITYISENVCLGNAHILDSNFKKLVAQCFCHLFLKQPTQYIPMQNPAFNPYIGGQFPLQPAGAGQMTALHGLDQSTAAQISAAANNQMQPGIVPPSAAGMTSAKVPRPDRLEVYRFIF